MKSLLAKLGEVPYAIQLIQVEGRSMLYYQLPVAESWLILAVPCDVDYLIRARNSMEFADADAVETIVLGGEPELIWNHVGLREDVLLLTMGNPAPDAPPLTAAQAALVSDSYFGLQVDAP